MRFWQRLHPNKHRDTARDIERAIKEKEVDEMLRKFHEKNLILVQMERMWTQCSK